MSGQVSVRAALETALNNMSPAISTAWENNSFTPPAASTPYQKAFVLFAQPANSECGSSHQQQGIFQIDLMYPTGNGDATARARALMLLSTFKRGNSFVKDGVTVTITHTPDAGAGAVDGDRWRVPVKCRFTSNIIT